MKNIWQLQEAKSRFSELVNRALTKGAQIVTRRGENVVVVMHYNEYKRLTQAGGKLSEFMRKSPLAGSEIDIQRSHDLPRQSGF